MSSPLDQRSHPMQTNNPIDEKGQPDSIRPVVAVPPGDAAPTPRPQGTVKPDKTVLSTDTLSLLSWHFWTIGPCLITLVLLVLNLTTYAIGTYLGTNNFSTNNILYLIQVASKVHEIIMVIGLVNIAQQAMHWSLLQGGTLLGLLGSEQSLGDIGFVKSKEFRAALSYGLSDNPRRKNTLLLVFIMFVVCSLGTVVGPSSAVLMTPELGWYFEQSFVWNKAEKPFGSYCYPYILVDPRLGGGSYNGSVVWNRVFYEPMTRYWANSMFMRNYSTTGRFMRENTHITHLYRDNGLPVVVNSSTSWDRILDVGTDWEGGTNFSTVVKYDQYYASLSLVDYQPWPRNDDSEAQFFADMTGIESTTVCKGGRKLPCDNYSDPAGNGSDWCFLHTNTSSHGTHLQRSQDLLLIADQSSDELVISNPSKVWITEGLRTGPGNRFTDSIVVVFENTTDPGLLIVCSTSAVLKSVQAISNGKIFTAEQSNPYGDHLYYFESSDSRTTTAVKRTLLYHESWLDMTYHDTSFDINATAAPTEVTIAIGTPRNSSRLTKNGPLRSWAEGIQDAPFRRGGGFGTYDSSGTEAGMVEIVVGGAFISILSRVSPSITQYSAAMEWTLGGNGDDSDTSGMAHYPAELLPEAITDCKYENRTLDVYHWVYGYQPGVLPSILSMVVLLVHFIVAILGSLRQLQLGGIMTAWDDDSEYKALFIGTDPQKLIGNKVGGIGPKDTLKILVEIKSKAGSGGVAGSKGQFELVSEAGLAVEAEAQGTGKGHETSGILQRGTSHAAP